MGIRAQAALDAKAIVENLDDLGWPLVLTSPAGVAVAHTGTVTDVGVITDPETGTLVSGRRASATLSLLSLPELPTAVADSSSRPWLVAFDDVTGAPGLWKVVEVLPDRALGLVVLILETYRAGSD
jgi:hypothetical protein